MVFGGRISRLMIGEVEDLWDSVAIAQYPSRKAMLEMLMDPDYQKSEEHRAAGLEGPLVQLRGALQIFGSLDPLTFQALPSCWDIVQ